MKSNILTVLSLFIALSSQAATTNELPKFDELLTVLRANAAAAGISPAELDRAITQGALNELKPHFLLGKIPGTNDISTATNQIAKVQLFDNAFAYFRIGNVDGTLPEKFKTAFAESAGTNKLKGLVLDLRFAEGDDYTASAKTADLFLSSEKPLLVWNDQQLKSTSKTNAISLPLAILVNKSTTGAAEALAGVLRETKAGLLIGAATAGQANIYKELPLPNGQTLRLASGQIKIGTTNALSTSGLKPDIEIAVTAEAEKMYLKDAYYLSPVAANAVEPRQRLNEAELVRMRKEGLASDEDYTDKPIKKNAPIRLVTDPALARALDLLKGLSVVQRP